MRLEELVIPVQLVKHNYNTSSLALKRIHRLLTTPIYFHLLHSLELYEDLVAISPGLQPGECP